MPIQKLVKVAVTGDSMQPSLYAGDWALFRYWPDGLPPRIAKHSVGKIVLLRRKAAPGELVVKRITQNMDTGFWVEGDNPSASTDSRHYLTVSREEIVGRLICRYHRAPRR